MPRSFFSRSTLWINPRFQYRNLVPAAFHIFGITLISMSLVQVPWFVISGGVCTPYLSVGQFFWFGYTNDPIHNSVFWIMAIISICYYVTILLEESLENVYPNEDTAVSYGYGFYLIASTGGIVLIGTFCTLILMQTNDSNRNDERCLINRFGDSAEAFDSPTPPPPYSIPPPPYTP
ncbi:hypothetical protein FQR65_LT14835 [Abscondita terminalis]|nr:hypothetical protein FQR65_LT14835 [Abscondita terminalis]